MFPEPSAAIHSDIFEAEVESIERRFVKVSKLIEKLP